jgi:hypothetical protein
MELSPTLEPLVGSQHPFSREAFVPWPAQEVKICWLWNLGLDIGSLVHGTWAPYCPGWKKNMGKGPDRGVAQEGRAI